VTPTQSNETSKTFSGGATILTGTFKADVTNDATGATVTVSASGPGFFPADGSTVVLRGLTLAGPAGVFGPGPTPLLTSGTTTLSLDSAGNVTDVTTAGTTRDLCADIA
jgi:hypothetical protein